MPYHITLYICMAKEAYAYGKRGLLVWQKRPISTLVRMCGWVGVALEAMTGDMI